MLKERRPEFVDAIVSRPSGVIGAGVFAQPLNARG